MNRRIVNLVIFIIGDETRHEEKFVLMDFNNIFWV